MTMLHWLRSALAGSALPVDGTPDVIVSSDCAVEQTGFADVDADTVADFTVKAGKVVYTWLSAGGPLPTPVRWDVPTAEEGRSGVDVVTERPGAPAQLLWNQFTVGGTLTEYLVSPDTMTITEEWSEPADHWPWYVGDIDGDGFLDAANGVDLRLSSSGQRIARPVGWTDPSGATQQARGHWDVGDLDADGFDDTVVFWRTIDSDAPGYSCTFEWGPASLHLGSPDGLAPEPLWQLWAPGDPHLGLAQQVVAVPGTDTLIVTMSTEGGFCYDWTPLSLGVIRHASSADAYVSQVVEIPELGPGDGYFTYLAGWLPDPTGADAVILLDVTGDWQGAQWFRWDAASQRLESAPSAVWYGWLELYTSSLSYPAGRQLQAWSTQLDTDGAGTSFAIWGRTLDEVGPPVEGVTSGDCTFWATVPEPPPPPDTGETGHTGAVGTDSGSEPATEPPPAEERSCGCGAGAGSPSALVLVGLGGWLAWAARTRRHPTSPTRWTRSCGRT